MRTRLSPISYTLSLLTLLLALATFIQTTHARQPPTSFCKCICFQNSTIIPLNSPPNAATSSTSRNRNPRSPLSESDSAHSNDILNARDPEDSEGGEEDKTSEHHRKLTCADCNRAFCLDYNLPICKNAKEEDVFTTCFQRDSVKDETVVLLFLCTTLGLLGWAIIKPIMAKFRGGSSLNGSSRQQQYDPVSSSNRSRNGGTLPSFGNAGYGDSIDETDSRTRGIGRYRGDSVGSGVARQGGLNS